ncbi:microtubule-associated protein futsch isoform X4 [Glycine soja]|uniref:microtubule-associated protein futsch isoform X4 n=1 Tax=Glycine max TaxID=3847 RepID=UPI0007193301|nr:microtubule-associated protein futsch isoform X4 [Glycine max]XP_028208013.1 microtubule-associated protein futsch isoform X4 [Glycine soja]|eukprot:XP_006599097.2 microtubule-associated protein futsch isoform X4 [Glycine max]
MEAETNSPEDASAMAFGQHQVTDQTSVENVQPAETLIEVKNQENTNIKHPNLEGETTEINPTNDTKEQEKVPVSHTREEIENEDDGKYKQKKAKETEEATEMQLLKTATDSPPEDNVQSTVPTSEIVKGETEEISQQQTYKNDETVVIDTDKTTLQQGIEDGGNFDQQEATKIQLLNEEVKTTLPTPAFVQVDTDQISQQQSLHNDESKAIVNGKGCIPEIEHDREYTVAEEPEQPETKDNVSIAQEEKADHQSEESSLQSVITNYITAEGPVTSQSITKLSDDADNDEQKTVESCSANNLQNKDAREIIAEEATDAKQSTDVDIPKSETKDMPEDKALQTIPNTTSVGNEAIDDSSQEERQPEAEFTEKFNKELQAPHYDTEEQKVPASHAKEKLGVEDGGKFNQEAKGIEEATKMQLPEEEVRTTLPTPAFVEGDTDQISQPQTLHDDESEAIDNAKSSIPEIEHDRNYTFVEEPEQPETKDNIGIVKEEPASHQSEESSVQSINTNCITAEGHLTLESSTKLTDNVDPNEQKTVESCSVENLYNQDATEIAAEEATDAKQSTDVETTQLETEGAYEDKSLQPTLDEASIGDNTVVERSQDERQPEAEFKEKINLEMKTPQNDTKETAEINTNDTEKQEEVPASQAKEKIGIEDDGKFNQEEAKGIEEAIKAQLPEEEVKTALPTAAFVQGDTDQIPQQQTLQDDDSEVIGIAKNIDTPEIESGGRSTVVEEPEQPENMDNIGVVKEEQADHQSEESSVSNVSTKHTTVEGHDTSESSTKLTGDFNGDEHTIVDTRSEENLENKNASEIKAEKETDANQSTDVKTQKTDNEGVHGDESLQPTLDEASIGNEIVVESSQDERQQEEEFTEKFNEKLKTPQNDTEETAETNTNDTEKQGIEDDGKFDQEKAKGIEEATKEQLPEEEVKTALPTAAFVQGDTDQIPQQQTLPDDDSEVIGIAKNIDTPEIEIGGRSTVVEEPEQPENMDNISVVKEEQADHQSEESSVSNVSTKHTTAEGHDTSESSTKLTGDFNGDEHTIVDTRSEENLENKNASEIKAEKETDANQSTDVKTQKTDNEGVHEDKSLQPTHDETSIGNETVAETSRDKRQPEAEFKEKINEEVKTPQNDIEETVEINTNDTEKQEEVPASHADEKQGIEDDGKFDLEEAKGIEEATKAQLPEEEVNTTLPITAFVQGDTDQIPQQQTLQDDDSEVIDIALKIDTSETELAGRSNIVEKPEQPENKDNIGEVKEEQADHQSEELSVSNVSTNYITPEGHVTSECSTKLTGDVDVDGRTIVVTCSEENLENKDACEITSEKETDANQSTDVEIPKTEAKGVYEDKSLQPTLDEALIGNETVAESSRDDRQPEAEFTEKINEEVKPPQNDKEETAEINTNGTEKQEEIPASQAEEKLGIEDDGKFDQEDAKQIEEATKTRLPEEEVKKTLPTAASVHGDTDQIPQQQTLDDDDSEVMDIAKNIDTPEIELGGRSTVVEEPEQSETKDNVGVVKEEQVDHQSEQLSISNVITNYTILEGHITSESSTKLTGDVDVDGWTIVVTRSKENLENKDACEITAKKKTDANQPTDVEIPKTETKGVHEDRSVQPIPDETLISNETVAESDQDERQPEAEFTEKINDEVKTPQNDTLETAEINKNDTEKQEEVPASHAEEKRGIEDDSKFDPEEAKGIEEGTQTQLPEEEVNTTLPTAACVQGDTDEIPQQQTLQDDYSEVIDIAKSIDTPEIELGGRSTVVEEPEQPENVDNVGEVKEEQAGHQSEELSVSNVSTNYTTPEGHITSESNTKLTGDVDVDGRTIVVTHSEETLDNKDDCEITAEKETDANQSTDVDIPKTQTEGVHKDKSLQPTHDEASIGNETVAESSRDERQPEAELTEKINEDVKSPLNDTEETAEINKNDTEKQKEIPASHTEEKLGIEDDGKFDQEDAKQIEQETKTQLPEKEVKTTLPTTAFVQGDTDQIPQQQTLHDDDSEVIDIAKNIDTPEIELGGWSTVVEEPEQPEKTDNIGVVKDVKADHQFEESNVLNGSTNYTTPGGHITSESSKNSTGDVDIDEQIIVDTCSEGNLENKYASEITAEKETDANQLTDVEIPKTETEGMHEDNSLQPTLDEASIGNETIAESSQDERQTEEELTEKFNEEVKTPQNDTEETAEINTNDPEKQEEDPASHAEEKLGIENDGKLDQEEAKGIEEATKPQFLEEEVKTTLPTTAFVQGDTDQIQHRQTLHDDESEAIDIAKNIHTLENELGRRSTIVEEPKQPENKDNIGVVKEEQADNQSEQMSMSNGSTNYTIPEGHVTSESSTKSTGDVDVDERTIVDTCLEENLENKDACEITAGKATDGYQSIDVEIPKKEIGGVPEDKALQAIPDTASIGNKALDESSQVERQSEAEFTEKFNEEVQTPKYDTEETAEINTTIDTEKQEGVPASEGKEKLGIEHDGKLDQEEAKGIEEATKMQLPEEKVQTTLPTAAFVQGDADQIPQQQTLHDDESEAINIAKNICTPEIELDEKSTVDEQCEQPETKDNIGILKQQADHQSVQSSVPSVITNYATAEGHVKSKSSTKLTDDVNVDQQKTVDSCSKKNLENKDTSEISAKQAIDAKQSTDAEIPKSETEGVLEDKALQTILDEALVKNEAVDESSPEDRQLEAEFTEKFNEEGQTPQYDIKETAEINTTNATEKQEEVPASNAKENVGVEDDSKFNQEEAKGIEEATIKQLPVEEVETTLPTDSFVQGDTDQKPKQQTLHHDESEVIDIAQNIYTPEIELDRKFIVVEEPEQPETKDIGIVKEEQANHQSQESSMQTVITSYTTAEGHVTSESTTKLTDDVNIYEQKTINARSIEDLENRDASEITAEQVRHTKQSTDGEIPKSETKGVPEDKALQTILDDVTDGNEAVDQSRQEARQPEPKFTEKFNEEVQTTPYDTEETSEINATNDTEKQEKVQASHTKEKLGIEDDGIFYQEEAKGIEEATKMQLLEELVQTTLPTVASVEGDIDQISQQQTLHDDESEAIDNAKSCISEIEPDRKSTAVEEPEQPETKTNTGIPIEEEADHQSEESSVESLITNYITAEGHVISESSTKLRDDVNVNQQKSVESGLVEFLENKDAGHIRVEGTYSKQLTDAEIQSSETEGPQEEEVHSKLPAVTVQGESDQNLQQQTLDDDESEAINNAKRCIPEKELDRMSTVVEEPETNANVGIVKEEQSDNQSQGSSMQNMIANYITAEGHLASESNTKLNYDVNEQKIVDSQSEENLENKDASKITTEEATDAKQLTDVEIQKLETDGVPENNAMQTLPNIALVRVEEVHDSKQEEIQRDAEFSVTFTKKMQTTQYEFDAKNGIPEAYGEKDDTCHLNAENEQKLESQPVAQNKGTTFINHPYQDGETAEMNPTNGIEVEKIPANHAKEKLVIEDDGKFNQEEAKGIEEATKTLLLNTATESLTEEEVQEILPTPAIVQRDTKQIMQQQTLHNDESEAIDKEKSCIPENELDRKFIAVEESDQPETKANAGIVKEEQADNQSQVSSMQSVITNYITAEGHLASESSTKLSFMNEQKTVDASVENLEIKDASEITAEEATDAKQLTDEEIQKSETESVYEDKALQTLPSTASVRIEVEKSIQEIHTETELAVTDTKEGQISENESEAKKEVSEYMLKKAFDLHKVACQTGAENELKAEFLSEERSQETIVTKHPNLEGESIEINPTSETEEHEQVPASHTGEKLEINDDGNFIQEEEKEMEKETERQLLKTATESVPEDEVQTTLPTSTIVKGETVEGIVQEQTLEEEKSAAIDNNSGRPENKLEGMANVVETIDQHESMAKVSTENEEHANRHSEQSSMENVITKHINSEGMVTTENSTKSSYNVEELEKVLDSNSIENSEMKDGRKILSEEASNMKEATGMELQKPEIENAPEDKAISTLPEIVEESIQEVIQKEAESEVIDTKEEQRPGNDFVKNMEVLEGFDLHKAQGNTTLENEMKAEVQSEAKSREIIIEHQNLLETAEISPRNDTKEPEKEHKVTTGISESVSADTTEQTDTGKPETPEAEITQPGITKEDEAGDEFEKISPSSSVSVISRDSQDTDTKVSHKKSHGILSGVGSKVKHSISKVKKAITGKSSHPKTPPSSK